MNVRTLFRYIAALGISIFATGTLPAQGPTATSVAAPGVDPKEATIQLQFPNNGVSDVLGIYELLTGKAVIKESGIFDGKPISLVTARPVTQEEAIDLIESSLQLNNYVLTQAPDGRSVRVALGTVAQANLARGLTVYESPDELPKGHSMACYYLRLHHLDPSEAAATLWSHLGLNVFGRLTPVASPPSLLITENADNIRQILRAVAVLDVPQDKTHLRTEFYPLRFADAVVVGQVITSTFTARQIIPPLTTDTFGDVETRIPARLVSAIPPRIVADDRLNRIMVVALEADHAYVRKLIEEFDKPIKEVEPLERRLRYIFVDQVIPVLVDVLQDTGSGSSTLAAGEVVRTRRPPQASSDPATLSGRPRRAASQIPTTATPATPAGYEDRLVPPEETAPPLSVLVGKTRLVADIQANKLIAYGPREDLTKITSLLDRLDRKPPQVYLSTIIGQLTLGDNMEFGVDFLRQFQAGGKGNFGVASLNSPNVLGAVPDARKFLTTPVGALAGLNVYGQISDGVALFVRALEATQRFKVLSRPTIYAANNKKASITSGRRIPVPTSSITDLSNTASVRTNIAFQDVVLKLEVIPLINSDKEVNLTIAQVNDNVVGQQQIGENTVPIIATERLLTTVTVANRSTIVLGGLITENEEKSTTAIPYLSRIPVLGYAFKSKKTLKSRKELLIFIQPVVVQDGNETAAASSNEERRTEVADEAAETFPEFPPRPLTPPVMKLPLPPLQPGALPGEGKTSTDARSL